MLSSVRFDWPAIYKDMRNKALARAHPSEYEKINANYSAAIRTYHEQQAKQIQA